MWVRDWEPPSAQLPPRQVFQNSEASGVRESRLVFGHGTELVRLSTQLCHAPWGAWQSSADSGPVATYILHPATHALHSIPCTPHPAPHTLHPTPYTPHPTP